MQVQGMASLSAIILTKNEENNIEATVKNALQCADEVLVVDSGSTDRTVELAKNSGARVVYRAWDNDFSAQRNFALSQTEAEWVLYLDADEHLNHELVTAIKKVISESVSVVDRSSSGGHSAVSEGKLKQYSIQRKSVAFGTKFSYGVLYPDWVPRLFPRKSVKWEGKVHERPECSLPVEKLNGHIEHFTYKNWQEWEEKLCRYTTIWAEDAYKKGKRTTLPGALLHSVGGVFKMLIVRRGFMDGWMGICLSITHFFYTLLKYLKLYELQGR